MYPPGVQWMPAKTLSSWGILESKKPSFSKYLGCAGVDVVIGVSLIFRKVLGRFLGDNRAGNNRVTEPGITELGIPWPRITDPRITEPGITEPGKGQLSIAEPVITGPGINDTGDN